MEVEPLAHTVVGTAKLIHVGPSTIWAKIASGEIPAKKAGRRTLILDADLREYLSNLPDARPAPTAPNLEAGAIRAAPPDTPDETPSPRRASEQEGRTGTRPSRNPQSRHDKDGGAATRGEGRG
jgi:excisionase family DNA binding protein